MTRRIERKVVVGGSNVFADLELPEAEDLFGKALLAAAIASLSSIKNVDGPRGLDSVAPQWWPETSNVCSARVSAT